MSKALAEQRAKTLDPWRFRLTVIPSMIECPRMHLQGRDFEPPVFVGPGYIDIRSASDFRFTLFAATADDSEAFRRLIRARENPYEIFDQFRLVATDYQGHEWACGWTSVALKENPQGGWPLTGHLNGISIDVRGPDVCPVSGVELLFQPRLRLPMDTWMTSTTVVEDQEILRVRAAAQHVVRALDTEITFAYSPSDDSLWVGASSSARLPHPYAENWLSEPLRILMGQLVYPRLVARNFGDGRAFISLRLVPEPSAASTFASLSGGDPLRAGAQFWELYADLLELIAGATGTDGNRNFESHPITRFYEEIIQSNQGSRWVLCLACASAAEGLAKMLMGSQKVSYNTEHTTSLSKHVLEWQGDDLLRARVVSYVAREGEPSVGRYLKDLVVQGLLTQAQERAWSAVRHEVMHGNLVSPWGTEEQDQRIRDLGALVHGLTRQLIRRRNP